MSKHKTKIGGTAYSISGGKAKVNGTAYGIKKGKTKVGGTAYDINFGGGDMCEVTVHYGEISTTASSRYVNLKIGSNYYYNGNIYTETVMLPIGANLEFYYPKGDKIYFNVNGSSSIVAVNKTDPYYFPLTTAHCDVIVMSGINLFSQIRITTSD